MDMMRKLVTVQVKEVGERILEIAGSTEDKDRVGDIIRASGWKLKQFKANPVFMWVHDYSMPPIGRATKVWIDKETKRLMFKVEFASPDVYEFADTIFKLYKGNFLHATSVGFIPLDWDGKGDEHPYPKWEGNIFTSQELLELSAVPVPANPYALVDARDQGFITVKEFESVAVQLLAPDPIVTVTEPEETDEAEEIEPIDIDKLFLALAHSQPNAISQEQLRDDIDYLHKAIVENGMAPDTEALAFDMAREIIKRSTGADIPDDIFLKAADVVAEQVEPEPEPDPVAIAKQRARDVAEVVNIVIAKLKGKRIK